MEYTDYDSWVNDMGEDENGGVMYGTGRQGMNGWMEER